MFKISDLEFQHEFAELDAFWSGNCLRWGISINGKYSGRLFGEEWQPRAYSERIPEIETAEFADLSGKTASWGDPYIPDTGGRHGALCVFEHLDIRDSKIAFSQLNGLQIPFVWTGLCDVFFNARYRDNLPITIEGIAIIDSVYSEFENEQDAHRAMKFMPPQKQRTQFKLLEHPIGNYISKIQMGR